MLVNGLRRHHQAHLVEYARLVNGLTDEQRETLGFTRHDPDQSYDRIERLFLRLCCVLDAGHTVEIEGRRQLLNATWFANCLPRAAIPNEMLVSSSWAVDGTDVETWAVLHGQVEVLDAEDDEVDEISQNSSPRPGRGLRPKAKVLGVGPDGRNIYTADPDARGSHRSATNSRVAGKYVGYELHLGVQTRDLRWTNYVDKVTLSDEVPGVITMMSLVPAGSHRGRAVADVLIGAKRAGMALDDVVVDPGYSIVKPGTMRDKLAAAGIHTTFHLTPQQRGLRPFSGEALLVDGQLFSSLLPSELLDLPMPPRGAPESVKMEYEAAFNRREIWRLVRHAGPDRDGATRWRCPFDAGRLRSRRFPRTMRRGDRVPLVALPEDIQRCCSGIVTAMPAELPLWQQVPFGTTAWRKSMGRRQPVESANAGLKGEFVDVSRGFHRVFGTTKIFVLLAFSAAGYNVERVRSFRAKHRLQDPHVPVTYPRVPATRAKRRKGTWADVVDARSQGPSRDSSRPTS
ncbi:MAG TPA: hypothetical protein VII76_03675 [Acidimicrobiales bacterium]